MRALIVMTGLFVCFVVARFYVFNMDAPKPTPKMYDKPVWLRMLEIPKENVPQGYSQTIGSDTGKHPSIVKADTIRSSFSRIENANLPRSDAISEYLVATYSGPLGEKAAVITAQYKTTNALEGLNLERYREPHFMVLDHQITWIDAETDDIAAKFLRAFRENAMAQKKQRGWIEKLVVSSNAYLKFFADLLVGAFGFVLALFFTKYFLIIRQVEK